MRRAGGIEEGSQKEKITQLVQNFRVFVFLGGTEGLMAIDSSTVGFLGKLIVSAKTFGLTFTTCNWPQVQPRTIRATPVAPRSNAEKTEVTSGFCAGQPGSYHTRCLSIKTVKFGQFKPSLLI